MKAALFTADTFPYDLLQYVEACPKKSGRQSAYAKTYANIIATFDIETTMLDELQQGVMWHWQACVDGMVCTGRTWDEYRKFLTEIDRFLPQGLCFVQYVHNLAFEFQHLKAVHNFAADEVFCVTGRKVVKCNFGDRFEYRCSYFLTNMSLREFLKKYQVEDQKTEMDYAQRRFPWTKITPEELQYCIADVLGLWEALTKMFKMDGYTLASIPISSTGFVREDFKRAMRKGKCIGIARKCAPDYPLYKALRRAFRGGNTHCSRLYTGVILGQHNGKPLKISSYDRTSSYPDVILNDPFPIKPFHKVQPCPVSKLPVRTPYLVHIDMRNVKLKNPFDPCPYLAIHKCQVLTGCTGDNGRIVSAQHLQMYMTDIDMNITLSHYNFDGVVLELWVSEYGMLPQPMRDTTMKYYKLKTELKGDDAQRIYYDKAKSRLNSIYG
jgi:hypothetical protein